jgi:hypothetical protein
MRTVKLRVEGRIPCFFGVVAHLTGSAQRWTSAFEFTGMRERVQPAAARQMQRRVRPRSVAPC